MDIKRFNERHVEDDILIFLTVYERPDKMVAVVGNAQAVCGLAIGGGGKVGADPACAA